jgi:hypothetical protein
MNPSQKRRRGLFDVLTWIDSSSVSKWDSMSRDSPSFKVGGVEAFGRRKRERRRRRKRAIGGENEKNDYRSISMKLQILSARIK